jgi:hypothetical protein
MGEFHADVGKIPHRVAPILNQLRVSGAPVTLSTSSWSQQKNWKHCFEGPISRRISTYLFYAKNL